MSISEKKKGVREHREHSYPCGAHGARNARIFKLGIDTLLLKKNMGYISVKYIP
jgi:hypothetical protein